MKKSGNAKSHKPTSAAQSASKPANTPVSVTNPESTVVVPSTVQPEETLEDQLERKGSEGSLQSTDSESTSSTNSEKSEKDETSKPGEMDTHRPLAKDQGTGQTIPMLLTHEEYLIAKAKLLSTDDDSPTLATDGGQREGQTEKDGAGVAVEVVVHEREEGERREKLPLLPTPRVGRSKKKLRQQQRKEEKMRRKERDRERHRDEEDRKRDMNLPEIRDPPQKVPPPLAHSVSVEEAEEQVAVFPTEPPKPKKTVAVSPKKNAKRLELKSGGKPPKSPGRSKIAPAQVTSPPTRHQTTPPSSASSPSPPAPPPPPAATRRTLSKEDSVYSDDSPEFDQPTHAWEELEDLKPDPSSPQGGPTEPAFSRENSENGGSSTADLSDTSTITPSSHPVEAIPISALRAMRTKGLKQAKTDEEESHASTKRSGGTRKGKEMERLPPRMVRLIERSSASSTPPAQHLDQKSHPPVMKKKSIPKVAVEDTSNSAGEVDTPSPEPTSDASLKSKSHLLPTSPHEIAASLLSNNPALKKRKGKSGGGSEDTQDGGDEVDDGKYDKLQTLDEEEEEEEDEEEISEKLIWAGDEGSPRKMKHLHHYKAAPTTLSLDAEPFYPSSEFPRSKHRGGPHHHHHHVDTPYAGTHARQLAHSPSSAFVSPEEIGSSFERKYRVREISPPQHLSLRAQHLRHHGHTLTPSPPPYPPSEVPSVYYQERRHAGIDSGEFSRHHLRSVPPDITSYEISQEEYYSSTPTQPRRVALAPEPLPAQRSSRLVQTSIYDDQIYPGAPHHHHHHHSQHAAAYEAAAQRRERVHAAHAMSRASPNQLWDKQHPYPYPTSSSSSEEEAAILRLQHRQRLIRKYQEEQAKLLAARRPVDALSPLAHTPHPRPARSTLYPTGENSTSNLWDPAYLDPETYPHQSNDDAFLSDLHHLRQQQRQQQQQQQQQQLLLQDHMMHPPPPQRRRRYSSDNELGGELVPDLLQTPSSPSHVSSSGLNKAPGTAFSGMVQARRVAAREQDLWPDKHEVCVCVAHGAWCVCVHACVCSCM